MARPAISLAAPLLAALLAARPAPACRYTVRDVAFTEVGMSRHVLWLCTRGEAGPLVAAAREAAATALRDSNVRLDALDVDRDPDGPIAAHLRAAGARLPALVLATPDGRVADLPSPPPAATAAELAPLIAAAVSSPARDEMVAGALGSFACLLVVEGTDAAGNRAAVEVADAAIAAIKEDLDYFPGPIPGPPRRVVVARDALDRERVLLASLGLDATPAPEARIAILFGRCRKLGGALAVPGAGRDQVLEFLGIVGQDCECGLDRRWMLGPTVPHRWGAKDREETAKKLGFDPDSPLVKAEVAAILSRGPGGGIIENGGAGESPLRESALAGDRERIGEDAPAAAPAAAAPVPDPLPPPPSPGPRPPPGPPSPPRSASPLGRTLLVLAGLGAIALVWGTGIALRSRRST